MIWLLPFLIPWNSDPYLIEMGGVSSPVAAYPIELHERPGERMMMMTVGDFIRAKQRIESSPEFCSSAINSAVSECERVSNQIQKQAQQDVLKTRVDQQALINSLNSQLKLKSQNILELERSSKAWKWVAIGVGAVTVGATTAILATR